MKYFVYSILLLLLVSCVQEDLPDQFVANRTVIVYMAGDNDLTRQGEAPEAMPCGGAALPP
jgi:hypothetical protein